MDDDVPIEIDQNNLNVDEHQETVSDEREIDQEQNLDEVHRDSSDPVGQESQDSQGEGNVQDNQRDEPDEVENNDEIRNNEVTGNPDVSLV